MHENAVNHDDPSNHDDPDDHVLKRPVTNRLLVPYTTMYMTIETSLNLPRGLFV